MSPLDTKEATQMLILWNYEFLDSPGAKTDLVIYLGLQSGWSFPALVPCLDEWKSSPDAELILRHP